MTPRRPTQHRPWRRAGTQAAVDPARRAAYDTLRAVAERDAYANLVLPSLLSERGITGRDAALATELCYGTLRSLGTIDAILAAASSRPLDRVQPPVLDAVRLGAYQLLYTRVPPHAAVSTTVSLLRAARRERATGFGNAVLRRVAAKDLVSWVDALAPDDPIGRLALRHAHPEWVVRAFQTALRAGPNGRPAGGPNGGPNGGLDDGPDDGPDEVAAALAADNDRPSVHLAVLPGRADRDAVAEQVDGTPGGYSPQAVYLPGGAPGELPVVTDGLAIVQDEGSQLMALAAAAAPIEGRDTDWLDLCAGPGGKAAMLGALAAGRGASVVAVEVSPHRANLVSAATSGLPVRVVHADGRQVGHHTDLPADGFDRVLVDAPCTGLGALRRRPEARWRRTPSDLPGLVALQRELLTAGLRAVRPGGVVAYVTCSPHPEETNAAVTSVVGGMSESVEYLDARSLVPDLPSLGDGPTVQLWPHRHGTDAMFVAVLRRIR